MNFIDKSGPAFPVHPGLPETLGYLNSETDAGMSLRDYFAGKALQGLVGSETTFSWEGAEYAEAAYTIADAMLEARK